MNRILTIFCILTCTLLILPSYSAKSQEVDTDTLVAAIELLRGYNSVRVTVWLEEVSEENGSPLSIITNDVELRLRSLGIKVVPAGQFDEQGNITNLESLNRFTGPSDYPTASLKVNVNSMLLEADDRIVFHCEVKVTEFASITRDGAVMSNVLPIWETGMLGICDPAEFEENYRLAVRECIDVFANAYLSMNPISGQL